MKDIKKTKIESVDMKNAISEMKNSNQTLKN